MGACHPRLPTDESVGYSLPPLRGWGRRSFSPMPSFLPCSAGLWHRGRELCMCAESNVWPIQAMIPLPEKFDPIYAAIAGACIAMVAACTTAIIGGYQARSRQRIDLAHSATQKELERLHSLRREVYLPFSDAMSAAVGFIPTIPTCAIDTIRSLQPLAELGRHFARLSLIAPPKVIEPAMKAFLILQAVATALINKRWCIEDAAMDLNMNQQATQSMLDRQAKLLARMEALNDVGEANHKFQSLDAEQCEISQQLQSSLAEHEPLNRRKAELELEAIKQASEMLEPLREHTIPAIVAIRAEIGLPIDQQWYEQFSYEAAQTAHSIITKFQEDLKNALFNKVA